jgi:hypothetical protein
LQAAALYGATNQIATRNTTSGTIRPATQRHPERTKSTAKIGAPASNAITRSFVVFLRLGRRFMPEGPIGGQTRCLEGDAAVTQTGGSGPTDTEPQYVVLAERPNDET